MAWRVSGLPVHAKHNNKKDMYFLWMNYRTKEHQTKISKMSQAYSYDGFESKWWHTQHAAEARKEAFRAHMGPDASRLPAAGPVSTIGPSKRPMLGSGPVGS